MAEKPVSAEKPISNVFHGKITHVEHAPPYEIVTIELDVRQVAELTVAYIAVPGNSIREIAPQCARSYAYRGCAPGDDDSAAAASARRVNRWRIGRWVQRWQGDGDRACAAGVYL